MGVPHKRGGYSRRDFLQLSWKLGAGMLLPAGLAGCGGSSSTTIVSTNQELDITLTLAYAQLNVNGKLVNLRTMNQSIPAPTLRVRIGDTLRIKVVNQLPPNPPSTEPVAHLRYPNSTNLHMHGLHVTPGLVAPGVFGDFVLDDPALGIQPGETRQHEFHINDSQPPGAYWYHPHLHGSSAMQVGSGMAGALIVESAEGGINQVPEIAAARQMEFVFQAPITDAAGVLESFTQIANTTTNEGPFLVNGRLLPTIEMQRGEVQNWHFIHAGIFNFLNLVLEGHTLNLYSLDGNPRAGMIPINDSGPTGIVLAPGNRASVLVHADVPPGTYRLKTLNLAVGGSASVPQDLATIVVKDPAVTMALPAGPLPVPASLAPITDAELAAAGGLKRNVVMRILMGQSVPPNPPDWIYRTDSTKFSDNVFTMGATGTLPSATPPGPSDPGMQFFPFQSPGALKQTVALNSVEEWTIFNMNNIQHPFHIHINPIYITKINGVAVLEPYWVDTIALPRGVTPGSPTSVTFRTRFRDFAGSFVMHCHMLAHEDMGMMQLVEVV